MKSTLGILLLFSERRRNKSRKCCLVILLKDASKSGRKCYKLKRILRILKKEQSMEGFVWRFGIWI